MAFLCMTGKLLHFVQISLFLELSKAFFHPGSLSEVGTSECLSWVSPHLSVSEIAESATRTPGPTCLLGNLSLWLS